MPGAIGGFDLVVSALRALGALGAPDRFLASLGALGGHVPQGQLEGRYRTVVIAVMIALASERVAFAVAADAVHAAAAAVSAVKGVAAQTVAAAAAVPSAHAAAAAKERIEATVATPTVVVVAIVETAVASTSGKLAAAALAGPASGQPGSPSTVVAAAFGIVVISMIRLRREIASGMVRLLCRPSARRMCRFGTRLGLESIVGQEQGRGNEQLGGLFAHLFGRNGSRPPSGLAFLGRPGIVGGIATAGIGIGGFPAGNEFFGIPGPAVFRKALQELLFVFGIVGAVVGIVDIALVGFACTQHGRGLFQLGVPGFGDDSRPQLDGCGSGPWNRLRLLFVAVVARGDLFDGFRLEGFVGTEGVSRKHGIGGIHSHRTRSRPPHVGLQWGGLELGRHLMGMCICVARRLGPMRKRGRSQGLHSYP